MQELLIVVVFLCALAYLGRVLYKHTRAESGCAKGCGCDSPVSNFKKVKEGQ